MSVVLCEYGPVKLLTYRTRSETHSNPCKAARKLNVVLAVDNLSRAGGILNHSKMIGNFLFVHTRDQVFYTKAHYMQL